MNLGGIHDFLNDKLYSHSTVDIIVTCEQTYIMASTETEHWVRDYNNSLGSSNCIDATLTRNGTL
jgi:hypothetical protein